MSQLLPERTPEWLKPALGVDPSQVQELIGNRQASSLNGTTAQVPVKREAAVLMLLSGESAEEGSILLTHRSPSMRCLLYTSPSPRDGLLSRMPSSA